MRIVKREKVKKSLIYYGGIECSARPNAVIYRRKNLETKNFPTLKLRYYF